MILLPDSPHRNPVIKIGGTSKASLCIYISSWVISTWIKFTSLYGAVDVGAYIERDNVLHGRKAWPLAQVRLIKAIFSRPHSKGFISSLLNRLSCCFSMRCFKRTISNLKYKYKEYSELAIFLEIMFFWHFKKISPYKNFLLYGYFHLKCTRSYVFRQIMEKKMDIEWWIISPYGWVYFLYDLCTAYPEILRIKNSRLSDFSFKKKFLW